MYFISWYLSPLIIAFKPSEQYKYLSVKKWVRVLYTFMQFYFWLQRYDNFIVHIFCLRNKL